MATPISSAPSTSTRDGAAEGFRSKETEGTSANPEKASGEDRRVEKGHSKSKARQRDAEAKEMVALHHHQDGGGEPRDGGLHAARKVEVGSNELAPATEDNEMSGAKTVERGFVSAFGLLLESPEGLRLQHNTSPNSVLQSTITSPLCGSHLEGNSRASFVSILLHRQEKEKIRNSTELGNMRIHHLHDPPAASTPTPPATNPRYWSGGFFYLKDVSTAEHKGSCRRSEACPPGASDMGLAPTSVAWLFPPLRRSKKVNSELFSGFLPPATWIRKLHQRRKSTRPRALLRGRGLLLSSPAAKRAREVPSTAATRKAEAEKKRLKLINTSNKGQPAIQHFFKPSGWTPKASSASKPDPKDIIDLEDLPEDPADLGDSAKGASSSAPPQDQPSAAFAEPTEEEYEEKVKLVQASNAIRVDPRPTQSLQKLSLAERHTEVSAMLNKVWGKSDEEMQELTVLENDLKEFFAKHKEVRQTTRKLHEDLRVHVLEQITEIEGLQETAKHSSFDELSAKVKVLEAENESLKTFIQESSNKESEARKELSEKHARDLAELNEKLKKSQGRVTSLVAKNKVLEAEAEAIDKLIFRKRFSVLQQSTLPQRSSEVVNLSSCLL
ncbi:hypothetical protein QYE76_036550 [Lolium multiflorum]|uniref:Uncharacterized protein n=1 Tax=Lolium multiflorum TaxID=4521 RepID=A0AAD8R265_LOLMU|nr:hypothetical protein QYE76_036550 [Lolium multiflorum]